MDAESKRGRRKSLCSDGLSDLLLFQKEMDNEAEPTHTHTHIHTHTHEHPYQPPHSAAVTSRRGKRKGRKSITTFPTKAREKYTVQGTMLNLEQAKLLDGSRVSVQVEFCPFEQQVTVTELEKHSNPFMEITNLTAAEQLKSPRSRTPKARSFSFSDLACDCLDLDSEGLSTLYAYQGEEAYIIVCRIPEMVEPFLIDGQSAPRQPCETDSQLSITVSSVGIDITETSTGAGKEVSLQQQATCVSTATSSKDMDMVAHVREYAKILFQCYKSDGGLNAIQILSKNERACVLHNHVFEQFEYPIISRFLLLEYRIDPSTRQGKHSVLTVLGVQKLTSEQQQRAHNDASMEASLNCKVVKNPNGLEYYDSTTDTQIPPSTWENMYLAKLGKRCGVVENSRRGFATGIFLDSAVYWPLRASEPVVLKADDCCTTFFSKAAEVTSLTVTGDDNGARDNGVEQDVNSTQENTSDSIIVERLSSSPTSNRQVDVCEHEPVCPAPSAAAFAPQDKILEVPSDENCLLPSPPEMLRSHKPTPSPSLRQRKTILPAIDDSRSGGEGNQEASISVRDYRELDLDKFAPEDAMIMRQAKAEAEKKLAIRMNTAFAKYYWEVASQHAALQARCMFGQG